MTLKDQRENILRAFTIALDSCIAQTEHLQAGSQPQLFAAQMTFLFHGTTEVVVARPALDFSMPMEPQFSTEAKVTT